MGRTQLQEFKARAGALLPHLAVHKFSWAGFVVADWRRIDRYVVARLALHLGRDNHSIDLRRRRQHLDHAIANHYSPGGAQEKRSDGF